MAGARRNEDHIGIATGRVQEQEQRWEWVEGAGAAWEEALGTQEHWHTGGCCMQSTGASAHFHKTVGGAQEGRTDEEEKPRSSLGKECWIWPIATVDPDTKLAYETHPCWHGGGARTAKGVGQPSPQGPPGGPSLFCGDGLGVQPAWQIKVQKTEESAQTKDRILWGIRAAFLANEPRCLGRALRLQSIPSLCPSLSASCTLDNEGQPPSALNNKPLCVLELCYWSQDAPDCSS